MMIFFVLELGFCTVLCFCFLVLLFEDEPLGCFCSLFFSCGWGTLFFPVLKSGFSTKSSMLGWVTLGLPLFCVGVLIISLSAMG